MNITQEFRRFIAMLILGIFTVSIINPTPALAASANNKEDIVYPLKVISKLDCRFKEFGELSSNCKQELPVLKPSDYVKYSKKDGGYNDYTRLYTVLWASSYKYGWDVGNGGHMGVDIATAKGTPVYSMAAGKVLKAKDQGMLGKAVTVEHTIQGKKVVSTYAHMSKITVSQGEKIKAGEKVGEVGSTGNSSGNHLHFQIDVNAPFYPAYYNYKTCPYSYNKISEQGVCFDQLQEITLDPLAFLASNGKMLDQVQIVKRPTSSTKTSTTTKYTGVDMSVFNRTVHVGYNTNDVKSVQQIYKDLGYYKGAINGDYSDVEKYVIRYQIATDVVKSKSENGAGWFGPKTRAQTKKDYTKYLAKNPNKTTTTQTKTQTETKTVIKYANKVQKISKASLLTREQIEAKEVETFTSKYNINLKFKKAGNNVGIGKTKTLGLEITDKRGKGFKGNMPGGMTFVIDESKATVFPSKLYYFTDGKRDIKVTGKAAGNTKLFVKIGNKVIKTYDLKIFKDGATIYPAKSQILSNTSITLGERKTGLAVMKDSSNNNLINIAYGSSFTLKANDSNTVCIKKGSIKDIQKIYKSKCDESQYKKEITFNYNDTVGGILIYDYKAHAKKIKIEIINNYDKKSLATKDIRVKSPKGLNATYAYQSEVVDLLSKGIVGGINKGYFLENRELKQIDALTWMENGLNNLNNQTLTATARNQLESNLTKINQEKSKVSKYNTLSREELLELAYEYLVLNKAAHSNAKNYLDLDDQTNMQVSAIFNSDTTWKDKFGKKYFRPEVKVTRGEATFFLAKAMDQNYQTVVTYK